MGLTVESRKNDPDASKPDPVRPDNFEPDPGAKKSRPNAASLFKVEEKT